MKHKRKLLVNLGAEGGGGNQPTLFAPIITVSGNNVTWERDSRNGGFNDVLDATIDNQSVNKPLTITPELDSKLLKVKSIANNFKDGVATQVLEYTTITPVAKKVVIEIGELQNNPDFPYIYLTLRLSGSWGTLSSGRGKFVYNGTEYVFGANDIQSISVPITATTSRQEIELYFEKTQTETPYNPVQLMAHIFRANIQVAAGTNISFTSTNSSSDGIKGDVYALWNNAQTAHNTNTNYVYGSVPTTPGIMTYYLQMIKV